MLAGEAAMLRGMPVLAGQHRNLPGLAPVNKSVGDVDGAVAFRYSQRAAGAKSFCKSTSNKARFVIIFSLSSGFLIIRRQFTTQVLRHRATNRLSVQTLA